MEYQKLQKYLVFLFLCTSDTQHYSRKVKKKGICFALESNNMITRRQFQIYWIFQTIHFNVCFINFGVAMKRRLLHVFFSYCSTSLLSNDAKLFTRIAASRFEQLLPSVINADQTEFIQWKRLADKIYRLLRKLGFPDSNQAGDKLRGWRMFDQLVCISFRRKLNSTLIRFETWRESHLHAKPAPLRSFVVKRTRHIETLISDCAFFPKCEDPVSLTNAG